MVFLLFLFYRLIAVYNFVAVFNRNWQIVGGVWPSFTLGHVLRRVEDSLSNCNCSSCYYHVKGKKQVL